MPYTLAQAGMLVSPAQPAQGTTVSTASSADTYGSWVEFITSTSSAIYLLGIFCRNTTSTLPQYVAVQIGTGAAAAETQILTLQANMQIAVTSIQTIGYLTLFPFPVPVATSTRVSIRMADNDTTPNNISTVLLYCAQTDLVNSDIPSAATIADAVWDEAKSGHTTAGTYGQSSQIIRSGTAQSGSTSSTIKLDASASASDSYYNGMAVIITAGTGKNQVRYISGYVGATKVATVDANWVTTPDTTSQFMILG